VNQNQTFKHERRGGFLWAPQRNANGGRNPYYEFMRKVEPGDIIFSFVNSRIVSIAMASAKAEAAPKPDFDGAGLNWQNEGWRIEVAYQELPNPIRPKDHIAVLSPALDEKYSPLTMAGNGFQQYFFPVSAALTQALTTLLGNQFDSALESLLRDQLSAAPAPSFDDPAALTQESTILQRLDIGETQKTQLIKARRGQGVFRDNLFLIEQGCRVTGVRESRHLVASHIKPWRNSSDIEKLDGHNGLLLSPHVDHLFDSGFISFRDNGELITSSQLRLEILNRWHIAPAQRVGSFSGEQRNFLEYHRDQVLRSA